MIFHLSALCEFEALDLDDAFLKVSEHFLAMREGGDSKLILGGTISIEPNK